MEKILTGRERGELTMLKAIATKPPCAYFEAAAEMPPITVKVRDAALEAFNIKPRKRNLDADFDLKINKRN